MSKLEKNYIFAQDSKVAVQGNLVTVSGQKGSEKISFDEKVYIKSKW